MGGRRRWVPWGFLVALALVVLAAGAVGQGEASHAAAITAEALQRVSQAAEMSTVTENTDRTGYVAYWQSSAGREQVAVYDVIHGLNFAEYPFAATEHRVTDDSALPPIPRGKPAAIQIGCSYYVLGPDGTYTEQSGIPFGRLPVTALVSGSINLRATAYASVTAELIRDGADATYRDQQVLNAGQPPVSTYLRVLVRSGRVRSLDYAISGGGPVQTPFSNTILIGPYHDAPPITAPTDVSQVQRLAPPNSAACRKQLDFG